MKRTTGLALTVWLLALLFVPLGVSCDKDGGDDDVAWPERPADGCPIAFEFVEMLGEGERREAKLHLFNFTDKNVRSVNMTLHYMNAAGEELDTFPWGAVAPSLVAANSHVFVEAGVFIPADAVSVNVTVSDVLFGDDTTWEAEAE